MRPIIFLLLFLNLSAFAQNKAIILGTIKEEGKGVLIGVTVIIKGTTSGTVSDVNGKYKLEISPGTYNVEISYIGYEKLLYTGIKLTEGQNKVMDIDMKRSSYTIDQNVVIIGSKPLVDVEDAKSSKTVGKDIIDAAPNRPIQGLLNTQTGIVQNPEGIHIRGGRTYETGFYIDDVSANDPLAGTGFGIDIGSNAIDNVEVNTSSSDVQFGNATSGVVNTKTRTGGNKFSFSGNVKQDNLGINKDNVWNWNQTIAEVSFGGPLKFNKETKKSKLKYIVSAKTNFSDTYIRIPANQIQSSIYQDTMWSPRQDNRWAGLLKLNYDLSKTRKLSFSYLKSLNINQDENMLRITGNDIGFRPGYQYEFQLEPDNANTFTHDANLQSLVYTNTPTPRFTYRVSLSRLFVHLRADANGRAWRPDVVDSEFDPNSIVEFPTSYFNPNDSIVFVNSAPGLYNNGGIATLWHDHYVEEYSLKPSASFYSKNTLNKFFIGGELKRQDMRWIDITRPWIGAPIELSNGETTQSFRLGDLSDVWKVSPVKLALYVSDKFKFRGLIADVGLRIESWMPGKFVDDAVKNIDAPIADAFRTSYQNNTINFFGRRAKVRLLPKLAASFPIKENQVMYFNYGHSTVDPHPSFIYTGLDPFYADRSTQSRIGNPDLNQEVDISYELGLKSQITDNDALAISAYWKDKYDFITTASVLIKDVTGREVSRSIKINSDYARVRGLEISYTKRVKKWFEGNLSFSYSIATGQSSSASQNISQVLAQGNSVSSKELPLAWDSPIDAKGYALFRWNAKEGLWGKKFLNHISFYTEAIYRSGRRYTPYIFKGNEEFSGRPIYEIDSDPNNQYSKISDGAFWLNMNLRKWFVYKKTEIGFTIEINNALNLNNTSIVNPITGKAYQEGDDVPSEWRDPRYLDPRDFRSGNLPPDNPARYYEQIHILFGLSLKF
jgi:outer membrane receptor protein involved in Fe transport